MNEHELKPVAGLLFTSRPCWRDQQSAVAGGWSRVIASSSSSWPEQWKKSCFFPQAGYVSTQRPLSCRLVHTLVTLQKGSTIPVLQDEEWDCKPAWWILPFTV